MKWPISNKSRSVTTLYNYKVLGDPVFVESEENPHVNMVLSSQTPNRHGIWDKMQVTAFGRMAYELREEHTIEGIPYKVHDGCILTVEVINTYAPKPGSGIYENHVLLEWSPVIGKDITPTNKEESSKTDANEDPAKEMLRFLNDIFRK
ncbi:MAG: hypothetical protein K2K56_10625 [Lachnospiraceae bacterium]|nr:hypothetical protein [Lachnospiraceae bacterium]